MEILDKEVYTNLWRGYPWNISNLIIIEHVTIPPDPKVYSMIDQLKNTPIMISLYDLISTPQAHMKALYVLFKSKIIPTNILATTFF